MQTPLGWSGLPRSLSLKSIDHHHFLLSLLAAQMSVLTSQLPVLLRCPRRPVRRGDVSMLLFGVGGLGSIHKSFEGQSSLGPWKVCSAGVCQVHRWPPCQQAGPTQSPMVVLCSLSRLEWLQSRGGPTGKPAWPQIWSEGGTWGCGMVASVRHGIKHYFTTWIALFLLLRHRITLESGQDAFKYSLAPKTDP